MNYIIRTAAVLACAVGLCVTPCTAYAAGTANSVVGPGRVVSVETNYPDTEEAKQALAILTDLYANETDETMRRIAVDTSLAAICGTDPRNGTVNTTDGPLRIIGAYPKDPSYFYRVVYSALNARTPYLVSGERLIILEGEQPTHDIAPLAQFYESAKAMKAATAGMSDYQKASYIHDAIRNRLTYEVSEQRQLAVDAWASGKTACYGYAGLFYLLGTYCGLQVDPVVGMTLDSYHAWDTVMIDGIKKIIDVTWDDTAETSAYFLLDEHTLDGKRTAYTGDFDTMKELCSTKK